MRLTDKRFNHIVKNHLEPDKF